MTDFAEVETGIAKSTTLTKLLTFLSSVFDKAKPSSWSATESMIDLEVKATGT